MDNILMLELIIFYSDWKKEVYHLGNTQRFIQYVEGKLPTEFTDGLSHIEDDTAVFNTIALRINKHVYGDFDA